MPTVAELRGQCRTRGLHTGGSKATLLARLATADVAHDVAQLPSPVEQAVASGAQVVDMSAVMSTNNARQAARQLADEAEDGMANY